MRCAEGTCEKLLNGNRTLRVPHYRRAVAISASQYVKTVFSEYCVIGGLLQFQLRVIWKLRSQSTAL